MYNQEERHPYCGQQVYIPTDRAKKKSQEYIIVISGGSTAYGIGASSWDRIFPLILEKYLNEKNQFHDISKFVVVNAANPSYHSAQEKHVFLNFLFLGSDMDMFIAIGGFNNLARPLENYLFGLPLNYPGWP